MKKALALLAALSSLAACSGGGGGPALVNIMQAHPEILGNWTGFLQSDLTGHQARTTFLISTTDDPARLHVEGDVVPSSCWARLLGTLTFDGTSFQLRSDPAGLSWSGILTTGSGASANSIDGTFDAQPCDQGQRADHGQLHIYQFGQPSPAMLGASLFVAEKDFGDTTIRLDVRR
jgi:hypothetical protein